MKNLIQSSNHRLRAVLVLASLGLAEPAAHAAGSVDGFPTPGLYRVDTDSTSMVNKGQPHSISIRQHEDGKSGNVTQSQVIPGVSAPEVNIPGAGPITQCVQPRATNTVLPIASNCRTTSQVASKQGVTIRSSCPGVDTTTTVRQVDNKTWEYEIRVVRTLQHPANSSQVTDNTAMLRAVLEDASKNAPNAEAREKARKKLAELPAYQAQMAALQPNMDALQKQANAAGVVPPPSGNLAETVAKQRWVRIADHCS